MVAKKGAKDAERVPLQAIILADSFTTKFEPITLECPKALLPLVNTPMIHHTLSWLESAGVDEVFVVCCSHFEQILDYLLKSRWAYKSNIFVTAIEAHNCASAGDALRLIYNRNVIRGDFILVSGCTVSNVVLTQAIQEHKERIRKDMDAIMTMVIKQKSEPHDKVILGIDHTTNELLGYLTKVDDKNSYLTSHPSLTLHNDKQDCYIDICSRQVLRLFFRNDDYQHLRGDFVKELLEDNTKNFRIFTHEIHSSCYVARIDSFGSYDLISKDIIKSRKYPFVRFSIINPTKSDCIGKDTIIGDKTVISNSVVGDGCKIGCNVVIDGCYIWNNVTIEDGCKLRHAILCDGVVMKSGAVLEPCVVLSYKVVVGQKFVVPSYSKVSLLPQPVKQDSTVVSDVGEDGRGFIWSMNEVDHVEEWGHLVAPIIPESAAKDQETDLKRLNEGGVQVKRSRPMSACITGNVEREKMLKRK